MHPNWRNLGAHSSIHRRIKAFRAVDTIPGAEYNSSDASIACIELAAGTRARQKGRCRARSSNSRMKNFRTGVPESPIAGGESFRYGRASGCGWFCSFLPSLQLASMAGDQPNRGTGGDVRAGFSARHREFDHTGTGAVLVHLPIRWAARILTLAPRPPRRRVQLALNVIF